MTPRQELIELIEFVVTELAQRIPTPAVDSTEMIELVEDIAYHQGHGKEWYDVASDEEYYEMVRDAVSQVRRKPKK